MNHASSPNDQEPAGAPVSDEVKAEMHYEGNPKHKEPWQRGRKGSLCPTEFGVAPEALLAQSILGEEKRYACHEGKA